MLVDKLLALLGRGEELVEYVADRLGHDRRYSVDIAKITALGWRRQRTLDEALAETVEWYRDEPLVVGTAQGARSEGPRHRRGRQVGRELVERARAARGDRVHARRSRRRRPRRRARRRSRATRPDAIVHCAAWTNVDGCESDPDRAYRDNALASRNVMEAARRVGAYVVALSTDYVFDGEKDDAVPRVGHAEPALGLRRVEARGRVRDRSRLRGRAHLVGVRAARLEHGEDDPAARAGEGARCGSSTTSAARPPSSPISWSRCARSWSTGCPGTWHVTNQGALTWYEFARVVLTAAGDDPGRVEPIKTAELDPPRAAPRPANSVLDNRALRLAGRPLLPDYRDSLDRLVAATLMRP